MFGLIERDLTEMRRVFAKYPEIGEIIVFGSRAMENFKKGSDVDIALKGPKITSEVLMKVLFELNEETTIPYFFDVLHYEKLNHSGLREHIDVHGKRFR